MSKIGKSGYVGVSWSKQKNKWRSRIVINKKEVNLGFFDNPEDASDVYNKALEQVPKIDSHANKLAYIKKWQNDNIEKVRAYKKKHKEENKTYYLEQEKNHKRDVKLEIIKAYGGVCECCRENSPVLLTIDHINNNGKEHRKLVGGGFRIYQWLKKNGFPKDNYRLLCYNCNIGRYKNGGICPHQENKNEQHNTT